MHLNLTQHTVSTSAKVLDVLFPWLDMQSSTIACLRKVPLSKGSSILDNDFAAFAFLQSR